MIFYIILIVIIIYCCRGFVGGAENYDDILRELNKYNAARVIKYLQIKSGSKSLDLAQLVKDTIKRKKIKPKDFVKKLKINEFTFMTAPQREVYFRKLNLG